jgi:predicted secreted protein
MGFWNALFIYFLIWWTTLFLVLPLGVARNTEGEKGHDAGAPIDAQLKRKLIINTLLSGAVLAVIWILVEMEVITWGAWFRGAIK